MKIALIILITGLLGHFGYVLFKIERANMITQELAKKCKEISTTKDLVETGVLMEQEARKYDHLKFHWSKNGSASIDYRGIRGIILHSDCRQTEGHEVDSL